MGGLGALGDLRGALLRVDEPHQFFSVDVYTCKAFDADAVTAFTSEFFGATETVSRGF